jgi:hypothetical protein
MLRGISTGRSRGRDYEGYHTWSHPRLRIDCAFPRRFGLFAGQFGYALNNLLVYINGGAAVTSDLYEDITTVSGAVLGSVSQTRWGGTAATDVEYGFTPNWTAAFEHDRLFI